jgi:putative multiple sugar transport system permease protein
VGIPAFIVTLAGMLLFRGFNQFVGKSNTIPVPSDFQYIGSGYLPEVGPNTGFNNLTLLLGLLGRSLRVFSELRVPAALPRPSAPRFPKLWVRSPSWC